MYQTTIDSELRIPATPEAPQYGSLVEKIYERLVKALKTRPARNSKTALPGTFIDEHLLYDLMGPEIKRALRI